MNPKALFLSILGACLFFISRAQFDSSVLKTGNISLPEKFTQHTTIKGEDLEHLPFSSLDEAINVYFNGAYTNNNGLTYVIDGNPAPDINSYSIHDIESITLLHDARSVTNGAEFHKQLVLITTRTGFTRKSGITIAASSYYVKRRAQNKTGFYDYNSPTLFDQLHVAGRYYKKHIEIGVSANYLHEAFPVATFDKTLSSEPFRMDRFRFSGWMSAELGRSILTVRINASPYNTDSLHEYLYNEGQKADKLEGKNWQLYPTLALFTKISSSWYNQLNLSYVHGLQKTASAYAIESEVQGAMHLQIAADARRNEQNIYNFQEEIGFRKQTGKWSINPALNISGMSATTEINTYSYTTFDNNPATASASWTKFKAKNLRITPVFNATFADVLNVQAGVQYRTLEKYHGMRETKQIFPFGSISLDAAKIISPSSPVGLMLYASHATSSSTLMPFYIPVFYTWQNGVLVSVISDSVPPFRPHNVTDVGVTLSALENRLKFSYTFETNRYYFDLTHATSVGGANYTFRAEPLTKLNSHRFAITYASKAGSNVSYNSSISIYNMHSAVSYTSDYNFSPVEYEESYPRRGWSGGWVNRFGFKHMVAGIGCLYYFDAPYWVKPVSTPQNPTPQPVVEKFNSFVLQNIYAGYNLGKIEFYISSRNLFQNKKSTLASGYNAYYGLGFKAAL